MENNIASSDNEFMNNTDNDLITMVNAGEPISTYLQLAKKNCYYYHQATYLSKEK